MQLEDDEEGINMFREACKKALSLIYPACAHVTSAINVDVGLAQIRFAMGLEDRSMRDVAASLNVTVACISKGAKAFVHENDLPMPACMKSEEASETYRNTRSHE